MKLCEINPYIQGLAEGDWVWHNYEPSISYSQRIFYIKNECATVKLYDISNNIILDTFLVNGDILLFGNSTPYFFDNADNKAFHYICMEYSYIHGDFNNIIYPLSCHLSDFISDHQYLSHNEKLDGMSSHLILRQNRTGQMLCERIRDEYLHNRPYYSEMCSSLIKALLAEAFRQNITGKKANQDKASLAKNVMDYINMNYSKPITMQDISRRMHYHPYYLARVFAETYGTTPHRYLIQCRMNQAMFLLKHSDNNIYTIALQCGFVNASHFSSAVLRYTGQSPKEIRNGP